MVGTRTAMPRTTPRYWLIWRPSTEFVVVTMIALIPRLLLQLLLGRGRRYAAAAQLFHDSRQTHPAQDQPTPKPTRTLFMPRWRLWLRRSSSIRMGSVD